MPSPKTNRSVVVKKAPPAKKIVKPAKKVSAKVKTTVHPPTPVLTPTQMSHTKSQADQIWVEIKDLPINMFGLPDQTVSMHVLPATVEPSKFYATIRSSATLPALETALANKFTVEMADKYVIVSRTHS